MGGTTKTLGISLSSAAVKDVQDPAKKMRRTKSEPVEFDDRWADDLIRQAQAEVAAHPMTTKEILAESERLSRAGAERAKKLGIKTDIRSAVRLIHAYRRARRSS
jgi:hypothetical protein